MKIGIYNATGGDGVGGTEFCSAVLAEALANEHDVEIVHHKPSLDAANLSRMFCVDLGTSRLRYVPEAWRPYPTTLNPVRRFREAKAWQSTLSKPYDLFIAFTHAVPPFCHATHGAFVVLFPSQKREMDMHVGTRLRLVDRVKRAYHVFEWRARMGGYRSRLAISEFTREWTRRRWEVDCDILHPPAGGTRAPAMTDKTETILSVGRFTTHGHSKKQMELMRSFSDMNVAAPFGNWRFVCVGGLTDLPEERAYFEGVQSIAKSCNAHVEANLERGRLDSLFAGASIFWHASGYGIDEEREPQLVEHYGISTVEAMAAGCIPVVINRGGQREIVTHGVDGFLWETFDELRDFTRQLIVDRALRQRMSDAARKRSRALDRAAFVSSARALIEPLSHKITKS